MAAAQTSAGRPATERVVLVAMAGGVRTRETFGTPANVPNLLRIAQEGVLFSRTRASNLGHYGATLSILTGISEARGIRDNTRGTDPTLFEYVRKGLGLRAEEVWVSTSGGPQEANVAYSLHPEYGADYGANTVDGEGIFNADFKGILERYGPVRRPSDEELKVEAELRAALATADADPQMGDYRAKVERFLLDELKRGTQDLKGVGASDAKAFRVARNLLAVFRPRLLAVVARDADVAHQSFSNYEQVIRRNDQMLGELWAAIQEDPELAATTTLFVLPEFGRDSDLNSRRGLDHGDGSDDLNYVSLVCAGPGLSRGRIVEEEVRTVDVCGAVCDAFGVSARYSRSKGLPRLKG